MPIINGVFYPDINASVEPVMSQNMSEAPPEGDMTTWQVPAEAPPPALAPVNAPPPVPNNGAPNRVGLPPEERAHIAKELSGRSTESGGDTGGGSVVETDSGPVYLDNVSLQAAGVVPGGARAPLPAHPVVMRDLQPDELPGHVNRGRELANTALSLQRSAGEGLIDAEREGDERALVQAGLESQRADEYRDARAARAEAAKVRESKAAQARQTAEMMQVAGIWFDSQKQVNASLLAAALAKAGDRKAAAEAVNAVVNADFGAQKMALERAESQGRQVQNGLSAMRALEKDEDQADLLFEMMQRESAIKRLKAGLAVAKSDKAKEAFLAGIADQESKKEFAANAYDGALLKMSAHPEINQMSTLDRSRLRRPGPGAAGAAGAAGGNAAAVAGGAPGPIAPASNAPVAGPGGTATYPNLSQLANQAKASQGYGPPPPPKAMSQMEQARSAKDRANYRPVDANPLSPVNMLAEDVVSKKFAITKNTPFGHTSKDLDATEAGGRVYLTNGAAGLKVVQDTAYEASKTKASINRARTAVSKFNTYVTERSKRIDGSIVGAAKEIGAEENSKLLSLQDDVQRAMTEIGSNWWRQSSDSGKIDQSERKDIKSMIPTPSTLGAWLGSKEQVNIVRINNVLNDLQNRLGDEVDAAVGSYGRRAAIANVVGVQDPATGQRRWVPAPPNAQGVIKILVPAQGDTANPTTSFPSMRR